MIYLDNAATMCLPPPPVDADMTVLYNPSSTYPGALTVKRKIETVREKIANRLQVNKTDIYFTSGATEANNWMFFGATRLGRGNIVLSGGEHASVYESAMRLKQMGHDVRVAPILSDGTVDHETLFDLVDAETTLVSVIHVSNETGFINDLNAISVGIKRKNPHVVLHSDGVQAFLKTSNSIPNLQVDAYSISGHKIGAPTGIGALYVHKSVKLQPMFYGGGQEGGRRAGTENVQGICALGCALARFALAADPQKTQNVFQMLLRGLQTLSGVTIVGEQSKNPHSDCILCTCIEGVRAEILQSVLYDKGVVIGRGSACSSKKAGNRVLEATGLTRKTVEGAVRFSISPFTSANDIECALPILFETVAAIRENRIG